MRQEDLDEFVRLQMEFCAYGEIKDAAEQEMIRLRNAREQIRARCDHTHPDGRSARTALQGYCVLCARYVAREGP